MDWLKNIPDNEVANMLVIDSDILIRLYNDKLSKDDALEFAYIGLTYKAHLCISAFTYFEFFKGITDDNEYEKRLKFLLKKTDGILSYGNIGLMDKINPEYWLDGKTFNVVEFKRFYSLLKDNVYSIIKKVLINLIDGITVISLMVKGCLEKIDIKCWYAFAMASEKPDVTQSRLNILEKIIDKNFKDIFFDKKLSEQCIDDMIKISLLLFNGKKEDPDKFVPTNFSEIKEFLLCKNEACSYVKSQNNINCKSCATFCKSFLEHLNRKNEKDIVFVGLCKLIIDYFNGRKVSSNDFIDLLNISSIETGVPKTNTFYGTKEKYWNNEFIRKYAQDEDKIWKCTILEFN